MKTNKIQFIIFAFFIIVLQSCGEIERIRQYSPETTPINYESTGGEESIIDGGWSSYTESVCSASCGGGIKTFTRTCTNPIPQNGGANCVGSSSYTQSCNTHSCSIPMNGGWSSYTESACSATCGGGIKTFTRTCTNPTPQNGGANCVGNPSYTQTCNTHACSSDLFNFVATSKSDCEGSISTRFSGKTGICVVGGGCGISCGKPSNTCQSANPSLWGLCTDGSDLRDLNQNPGTLFNFGASSKSVCEGLISTRFPGKTGTCTIGGGCGLSCGKPSNTCQSANPSFWGLCTYESDLTDVNSNTVVTNVTFPSACRSAISSSGLMGFDEAYYLSVKLAQIKVSEPMHPAGASVSALKAALAEAGFTPLTHYQTYGWKEKLAPNQFFNQNEYIKAKAKQLVQTGGFASESQAITAFNNAWQEDPYLHYLRFGAMEKLNPSNSFDESDYLIAKKVQLASIDDSNASLSIDQIRELMFAQGLTALSHYLYYGRVECIGAPMVPAGERVF